MRLALLALVAVAGTSCRIPPAPSDAELLKADIGLAPKQSEAEGVARETLGQLLKDPMSAVVKYGSVRRGAYLYGFAWTCAWDLPALVNAKNSYGGYVGESDWHFYFCNGSALVAVSMPATDSHGYSFTRVVEFVRPSASPTRSSAPPE